MLELLEANPHIIMDEHFEGNDEMTEEPEAGVDVRVWGNMVAFLERLDDEHFKSLQVGNAAESVMHVGHMGVACMHMPSLWPARLIALSCLKSGVHVHYRHCLPAPYCDFSHSTVCLQVIDPHTNQYLDRLKDEPLFLALAQKVSEHFTRIGDTKSLARVALRRMEHFYYKTDAVYDAMRKLAIAQQQAANVVQVRNLT